MNGLTLIYEFNCSEKGDVKASVWLFPGLVLNLLAESDEPLSEFRGAQKLAGPVDINAANELFESMKTLFQTAKIPLEFDAFADD